MQILFWRKLLKNNLLFIILFVIKIFMLDNTITQNYVEAKIDNSVKNVETLSGCFADSSTLEELKQYISSLRDLNSEDCFLISSVNNKDKEILDKYMDQDVFRYLSDFGEIFVLKSFENERPMLFEYPPGVKAFTIKDIGHNPVGKICIAFIEEKKVINVSCWIAKPFWGKGYAAKACAIIAKTFLKDNKTEIPFQIFINMNNIKSLKAFEKGLKSFPYAYKILKEEVVSISIDLCPVKGDNSLIKLIKLNDGHAELVATFDKNIINPEALINQHYKYNKKTYIIKIDRNTDTKFL